jgi:hypothetical protein
MDFFIDKFLCCFGIKQFDKKSEEEIFNIISLAMNNKSNEGNSPNDSKPNDNKANDSKPTISLENLNLGQSDPTEILETSETNEIVNKTPENELYYEEEYSSLVLTNSDEFENLSKVICGFFYTISFIIMINLFVIQRQFLIKNYFK